MPSAADRLEFGPPPATASLRALGLALLVHALLIVALTWGVHWKRSDKAVSFEAELWSSMPQEAAPRLVEAPPPPPSPPTPTPEVKVTPPAPDVDIALEQEKKRKRLQQQKEAEAQKLQDKQKAELQAKKEKELNAKEELAKRKAAEETKKTEVKKQDAKEQATAAALADQRKKNLDRVMGMAGATGGANATGIAQKSSGPSGSYGGKVKARVLPNVVFTDDIAGNPTAEVEVRTTLDGTITSQRLIKSSGNKAWDEAVIKAIIRTGTMPRDIDGRVPTPMILEFRPKD